MSRISTIVVMAVLAVAGTAVSAPASMSAIERRVAAQRACQAAIWAMPAVDTWDSANSIRRDLGGEPNDVVSMSRPMVSRHGFLTANDVMPYAVGALTTKDGPLVVELPPAGEKAAFFGTFVDSWMRPVADVGPTGFDERKGGKYLFLPPGYKGAFPEGYLDDYGVVSSLADFLYRDPYAVLTQGVKIVRGAALGAGIGAIIDGGEGAAWGAGIGAVAGTAAAAGSPGNQVAVGAGTALEFRLARPLGVDALTEVAAAR